MYIILFKDMIQSIHSFNELKDHRRINIIKHLIDFFPNDISVLISKYDYIIEGKSFVLKNAANDTINYFTVLPDGRIIVGMMDSTLRIWNVQTGICEMFPTPCLFIGNSAVLPNNSSDTFTTYDNTQFRIINGLFANSGGYETSLSIWQNDKINTIASVKGFVINISTFPCNNLHSSDHIIGILIDGLNNDSLKIWNLQSGECKRTFTHHNDTLTCFTTLPDGQIIVGLSKGKLFVWNPRLFDTTFENKTLDELEIIEKKDNIFWGKLPEHSKEITCVATLLDGRIVTGSRDHTLKIWNLTTGECEIIFTGHLDEVWCVAVLPDGRIVSGSRDKTLKIWNPLNKNCDLTLKGHTDIVKCVAVLPDSRIVSGSMNGIIIIWC
jgi:WD40 repeat protein